MTHTIFKGLIVEELAIEEDALKRGIARYKRLAEKTVERGAGAGLKPVERLMLAWFLGFRSLIRADQRDCAEGKTAVGRGTYGPAFVATKPDVMACVTMHTVLSMCLKEPDHVGFTSAAYAVGRNVHAETQLAALRADGGDAWDELLKSDREQIKPEHVARIAHKYRINERWPKRTAIQVGTRLIERLTVAAVVPDGDAQYPAFKIDLQRRGKRTHRYLKITDRARDAIEHGHELRQHLRPRYQPMIVQPLHWTEDERGGYYETDVPLIIPKHGIRNPHVGPNVPHGVNALNATAWRIHPRILPVVEAIWEEGGNAVSVPRVNNRPLPPPPPEDATDDLRRRMLADRAQTYRDNVGISAERCNFKFKLDIAQRFAQYERIWFPHQLDFRGRGYPVPLYLNHQGDDVSRGLLMFARAARETDQTQPALMVHFANCCGVDKCSYEDRIEWTRDNWSQAMAWAKDPMMHCEWMFQDKPFQTLAAAMALRDPELAAHLPVQVDGSNNALQHYAAMLRCPDTAALTNLTASDTIADAYQIVADGVTAALERDLATGHEYAVLFDGWLSRKVVKQTTMTTCYAVTRTGAKRQLRTWLLDAGFQWPDTMCGADEEGRKARSRALGYLADHVMEQVRRTFPAASLAMAWLESVAKVLAQHRIKMAWTTPLGFQVVQPYRSKRYGRIETCVGELYPVEYTRSTPPSVRRQTQGVAPNFVHSYDASHLLSVAQRCYADGIDIAAVHDAYWTHAADVGRLGYYIRSEFVRLHETPALDALASDLCERYPDIPFDDPPPLGNFDLKEVMNSHYFFS